VDSDEEDGSAVPSQQELKDFGEKIKVRIAGVQLFLCRMGSSSQTTSLRSTRCHLFRLNLRARDSKDRTLDAKAVCLGLSSSHQLKNSIEEAVKRLTSQLLTEIV